MKKNNKNYRILYFSAPGAGKAGWLAGGLAAGRLVSKSIEFCFCLLFFFMFLWVFLWFSMVFYCFTYCFCMFHSKCQKHNIKPKKTTNEPYRNHRNITQNQKKRCNSIFFGAGRPARLAGGLASGRPAPKSIQFYGFYGFSQCFYGFSMVFYDSLWFLLVFLWFL